MKTTITLPDALVRKAERAARKMGMSRKQFFVLSISEYFEWRAEAKITRQLNRIYSQEKSKLDPGLQRAQLESLRDANQIARR